MVKGKMFLDKICKYKLGNITFAALRENGPLVYRLGRIPFTDERRVRFPYGLPRLLLRQPFLFASEAFRQKDL